MCANNTVRSICTDIFRNHLCRIFYVAKNDQRTIYKQFYVALIKTNTCLFNYKMP